MLAWSGDRNGCPREKTVYALDLSGMYSGANATFKMLSNDFAVPNTTHTTFATSSSSMLTVYNESQTIFSASYSYGGYDFTFDGTNFYGFRVDGEGGYKYGWLKVTAEAGNSFTINSFGYNSNQNAAAVAGQGNVAGVPDSGPGIFGLALIGAGAAGVRLLRKLRAGK